MKIGELADQVGLRPSAIRYYEERGLLAEPDRTGGKREYGPDAVDRLRFIKFCQSAGFDLDEVATILKGLVPGKKLSQNWKELAEKKIAELDSLVAQVKKMRGVLEEGLRCSCLSYEDCTLILSIGEKKQKFSLTRKRLRK